MMTNTGTQPFKAPEMFNGGYYDQKIDIWALGISIYQLISGYLPFEREYEEDMINDLIEKDIDFDFLFGYND